MTPHFQTFELLVAPEHEDVASAALWECGTIGVQVEARPGSRTALVASFRDTPALAERLAAALAAVPGVTWRPIELPDVDWVARFREDFRAFEAAGFRVVPEWDETARPGPRTLVIDPGRAFGTGTHQTTRLCLELLVEEAQRRPLGRVLDVGAGTGILAIAARRLGAAAAAAVDLDPEATASCMTHARLNQVLITVVQGDGGRAFLPSRFDALLANLMAPLLVERSAELRSVCAPGATLILSGLLAQDVPAVAEAYAAGAVDARVDGEWAALRVRLGL
ncbi:MAG TPA: 50S ribosomal protein L11 methyltransferase [Vicinamibacteria bacterium]|nr:50S ribosomal protein L11 methyltransferase [Vicinamibacteria bacterium]